MGIYRSYFSKDNLLIQGNYVNTGLNPVAELFYGTLDKSCSRYIFNFDVSGITQRFADYRIPSGASVTHTLKMTNTLLYDKHLMGDTSQDFRAHATSFNLNVFSVPQFWDEGTGYDYTYSDTLIDINATILDTASNWFQATNSVNWNEPGIYSGTSSSYYNQIATIHFDLGDEDIALDITTLVNGLIVSGQTSFYGLGLAFTPDLEVLSTDKLNSVGFFGKDTNSFFEPFIETAWEETILDDRNDFMYDKINKLYLYTNIRKEPTNLDQLPTGVTITDYNGNIVTTITTGITQESLGVYSIELQLNSGDYDNISLVNFTDTWSGLIMQGKILPNIELYFTVKENNYYNIGTVVYEPEDFGFTFTGLKRGEQIQRGEVRKVIINVRKIYTYDNLVIDGLSYRLYIKQGRNQIDIISNCAISRAFNQNYFYLDTSWLVEQDYFLELSLLSNGTITKKNDISFSVIDNYSGLINFNI